MQRRLISGTGLLLLAVLFLAFNAFNHAVLSGLRLDLTEDGRYTLSAGSKQLLAQIDEPIDLYLYYSERAGAEVPAIRNYAQEVRDLLREYVLNSRGKLRLHLIDPEPFSEAEDRAAALGLQAIPLNQNGQLYFGLAGSNAIGERDAIAFLHPDRAPLLEYDISKLIHGLLQPRKPVVGLISGLPMSGGFDPHRGGMSEPWQVYREAREQFELRELSLPLSRIDDDIDLLWVVQPEGFDEASRYALEQYLLGGGRAALFIDPAPAGRPGDTQALSAMLEAWGIHLGDDIVLDPTYALATTSPSDGRRVYYPAILGLSGSALAAEDPVTARLGQINLGYTGAIDWSERDGISVLPLLRTSDEARLTDPMSLQFIEPANLTQLAGERKGRILAVRVSGKLPAVFADSAPEDADKERHLTEATAAANVIVVADSDLLADQFWLRTQRFFGQILIQPFADNGDLVLNMLEQLAGGETLLGIRSRAEFSRPFERVNVLRAQAAERFQAKEQELEARLAETEKQLAELRRSEDGRTVVLTAEQRRALEHFQEEQLRIRRELREVRYQLDKDIDALANRLKLANIALVPLLVAGFGTTISIVRLRRRQRARRNKHD